MSLPEALHRLASLAALRWLLLALCLCTPVLAAAGCAEDPEDTNGDGYIDEDEEEDDWFGDLLADLLFGDDDDDADPSYPAPPLPAPSGDVSIRNERAEPLWITFDGVMDPGDTPIVVVLAHDFAFIPIPAHAVGRILYALRADGSVAETHVVGTAVWVIEAPAP